MQDHSYKHNNENINYYAACFRAISTVIMDYKY